MKIYVVKMGVSFIQKLNLLASKTSPAVIYQYKPGLLLRAGGFCLSLVFLSYGATFIDWYYHSSWEVWSNASDEDKKNPTFYAKTFGPWGLTIIPFTIASASLYFPSRVVTKVTYIPRSHSTPLCKFERKSALLGRRIQIMRPIDEFARNARTRIYTGVGPQGVDDKSTFVFLLYDKSSKCKGIWAKYFILHRAGKFWGSDGRLFDALFGCDSIRELEQRGKLASEGKKFPSLSIEPRNSDNLIDLIAHNSKARFHSNGELELSKKIVSSVDSQESQKSK